MLILTSEQNLWKMSGGCSAKIHPNANDPVRCPCRDKRISEFIVLQKQEPSVTPLGALDRGFLSGLRRGRHQKLSPAKELGLLGIRPVRRGRNYAGRIVSYWAERGRLRDQSLRLTRHKNQIERDENLGS